MSHDRRRQYLSLAKHTETGQWPEQTDLEVRNKGDLCADVDGGVVDERSDGVGVGEWMGWMIEGSNPFKESLT